MMRVLDKMLEGITVPRMFKVKQNFNAAKVDDLVQALHKELNKREILGKIHPGKRIAIGIGSRGLCKIDLLARELVKFIKERGAKPFIIPAMGSHGGATAEGQAEILASLGITEAAVGCPIVSSMDVVQIGNISNGLPVYMDKHAVQEADGIVFIARIKPHTAFRNKSESGFAKMIAIGFGKHRGAATCHSYGYRHMGEHILQIAEVALKNAPILFAVGTVENAYDEIMHVTAVPAERLLEEDQRLLPIAMENIPRILFDKIDVLIVDKIGKEISGEGMDPNVIGRYASPYVASANYPTRIGVLDLTEKSHGNATGIGTADYITRRIFNKIDFEATYANCITAVLPGAAKIPIVMNSDYDLFRAAILTAEVPDLKKVRLVRIADTLHLKTIMISENMIDEAYKNPNLTILTDPLELKFDAKGNLLDLNGSL
ncbi:conserved hypothetical protein [Thermosinus carboxydivorans Nor1]|uniref:LarA-like N-terminal domain-containing protein n=1 Tax=Thermosinus carboxydivorans Nor1 TaxID=401526 RepID=A1HPH3_9FIRM|nr:lactate racemase domain-containing protein [Thermosinus carboxydivorans]EAX47949.1 conserved hypothetical protein [Thermosinus carboxydivorans Nor1]